MFNKLLTHYHENIIIITIGFTYFNKKKPTGGSRLAFIHNYKARVDHRTNLILTMILL